MTQKELVIVGEIHANQTETDKKLNQLNIGCGDILLLEEYPCYLHNKDLFQNPELDTSQYDWLQNTGAFISGWNSRILTEKAESILQETDLGDDTQFDFLMETAYAKRDKVMRKVIEAAGRREFSRIIVVCGYIHANPQIADFSNNNTSLQEFAMQNNMYCTFV